LFGMTVTHNAAPRVAGGQKAIDKERAKNPNSVGRLPQTRGMIPDFYAALGSTVVLVGSVFQFLRDARSFGPAVTEFLHAHDGLIAEQTRARRSELNWHQVWSRWRMRKRVESEATAALTADDRSNLRAVSRFSVGWACVAVGSLFVTVASWWQVAT